MKLTACFHSGLSTLRDSNEYDSKLEYEHQRRFQSSHGAQESLEGDASDTGVSPETTTPETWLQLKSSTIFDVYLS
jgi:Ras and EF-hand domain-containing protein